METALTKCYTKTGESSATANLPMGGFKHTGVAASSALTDYARVTEYQNGDHVAADAGGAADVQTLAVAPSIAAYNKYQRFSFVPVADNTGACTLNVSSVGAKDVKLVNGEDPSAGDLDATGIAEVIYDGTNFILLNPATVTGQLRPSTKTIAKALTPVDDVVIYPTGSDGGPFIGGTGKAAGYYDDNGGTDYGTRFKPSSGVTDGTQGWERAINGSPYLNIVTIDVSGSSDITPTIEELNASTFNLTGTITGNINIIFPDIARHYTVNNASTGNFTLTAKTAAGTGIVIPRAGFMDIESDGTNIILIPRWYKSGKTLSEVPIADAPNVISGHSLNTIAVDVHSSTICGGGLGDNENVIGGIIANVGTASSNVNPAGVSGTEARYAVIGGGYDNVNNSIASILTGQHCYIHEDADHGTISGGSFHGIDFGPYNTIAGGSVNKITITTGGYNTISGGANSEIKVSSEYSTIGGGSANSVEGDYSTLSGGQSNTLTGSTSVLGGGGSNTLTQTNAVISGGNGNSITGGGNYGVICGGRLNAVSADSATVIGGRENTAAYLYSSAQGYQSETKRVGQYAFANGRVAADGDAQVSKIILKGQSTNATEIILRDLSNGADFPIIDNSVIGIKVHITARRTDVAGEAELITIEALAHRTTGNWTVSSATPVALGTTIWTGRVYASAASLRVATTGELAKTIQWVASVEFTENVG